jgi:hypothetical protein
MKESYRQHLKFITFIESLSYEDKPMLLLKKTILSFRRWILLQKTA